MALFIIRSILNSIFLTDPYCLYKLVSICWVLHKLLTHSSLGQLYLSEPGLRYKKQVPTSSCPTNRESDCRSWLSPVEFRLSSLTQQKKTGEWNYFWSTFQEGSSIYLSVFVFVFLKIERFLRHIRETRSTSWRFTHLLGKKCFSQEQE